MTVNSDLMAKLTKLLEGLYHRRNSDASLAVVNEHLSVFRAPPPGPSQVRGRVAQLPVLSDGQKYDEAVQRC